METVKMRHPKLEGREIEVAASAVPHYKRSGWVVVGDEPAAADETKPTVKRSAQRGSD